MLYAKFQGNWPSGPSNMGMAAILSCDLDQIRKLSFMLA